MKSIIAIETIAMSWLRELRAACGGAGTDLHLLLLFLLYLTLQRLVRCGGWRVQRPVWRGTLTAPAALRLATAALYEPFTTLPIYDGFFKDYCTNVLG